MSNNKKEKRNWGDIGLKIVTPAVAGLLIAWAGFVSNYTLSSISSKKESARLITELQIRREQAESGLRKDVFDQTLQAFLLKNKGLDNSINGMSKQLLRLELLALNFGDSLSLSPLFTEFHRDLKLLKIEDDNSIFHTEKGELRKRLYRLARRVASTQVSSLDKQGTSKTIRIPLTGYDPNKSLACNEILYKEHFPWPEREVQRQFLIYDENYKRVMSDEEIIEIFKSDNNNSLLSEVFGSLKNLFKEEEKGPIDTYLEILNGQRKMVLQGSVRYLEIKISNVDHCEKTLKVQIFIHKPARVLAETEETSPVEDAGSLTSIANENLEDEVNRSFTLDYFNFPIVDNTRLDNNHRFAIVLDDFDLKSDKPHIELIALIFPSEYASLRDRPGMKEARKLLKSALEDDDED
jgi:hypothetical protein